MSLLKLKHPHLLTLLLLGLIFAFPQDQIQAQGHAGHNHAAGEHAGHDHSAHATTEHDSKAPESHATHADTHSEGAHATHHGIDGGMLEIWWAIPFVGILLSIALLPLIAEHFWHHNYGKVALFWAVSLAAPFYLVFGYDAIYEFLHIILLDYVPFIILLGSLFTVAGGICLKGSLRGSPVVNSAILILGAGLASLMGTTGAAMLLIRPIIKANQWRKKRVHIIVFFIFMVANIGGSLTPLGDPPLFLGFLKGVSFGWTLNLLPQMLFANGILIVIFFILDTILYKKEGAPPEDGEKQPLRLEGTFNFLLIGGIIGAILLSSSLSKSEGFYDSNLAKSFDTPLKEASAVQETQRAELVQFIQENKNDLKAVEGKHTELRIADQDAIKATNDLRAKREHDSTLGIHLGGVTMPFSNLLRDSLLLLILVLSLVLTKKSTREDNSFTWEPILEVAKLFCAIFLTIVPVLLILKAGVHGALAEIIWSVLRTDNSPNYAMYFWLTGILSSFLDNAPTYVVFFNTAGGDAVSLMSEGTTLLAISVAAVFMGANTYIGNAPNFMVKSIAEENGIKMPSFFGYMAWSFCILTPILILISYIWFSG